VRLWGSDGGLHAEVSDDGHRFDTAGVSPRAAARGLTGMRERAALIHGRLDILSDPAAGTMVRLEAPLQPAPEGGAEQVRVLLVEDHTAVRQAIAAMFERESDLAVVGQAASLAEARELLHANAKCCRRSARASTAGRFARELNISIRTERNHVASILNELGVHTQLQAVLFALRYGIIDPS
jgi:DNA-binding CsgD family transcriptional regulator